MARHWTETQLRAGLEHLAHGHTHQEPGHAFLTEAGFPSALRGFEIASAPFAHGVRPGGAGLGGGSLCDLITNDLARAACYWAERQLPGEGDDADATGTGTGFAPCIWPARVDPLTGKCSLFIGEVLGPDPNGDGRHAHGDTVPERKEVSVRRCRKGSVLGKDGWCHPKGSIVNKEREYPRKRKPLGTTGDLNAVTKAKAFSTRLVNNQKSLKKLAANLQKAGGGR